MEMKKYHVQIDATPVDILLDDLNKPRLHIYVAVDESGRCLYGLYGSSGPRDEEDLIDQIVRQMEGA